MNSRDIIKRLMDDGWRKVRMKGSHWQFRHPTKKRQGHTAASEKGFASGYH